MNDPYKTYGEEEGSDFEINLENNKVNKFMNNTVECTFGNMEIIDQNLDKNREDALVTGNNSTIKMGASLAYTHYSDKTKLLDSSKNQTKATAQPKINKTNTGPKNPYPVMDPSYGRTTIQVIEKIGICSECN